MGELKNLEEVKYQPVEALVKLLEELLADAKAGKMAGCSVAWVDRESNVLTAFGGDRLYTQLGAIEILRARMVDYLRDR